MFESIDWVKNYNFIKNYNKYLIGSKIIDMFELSYKDYSEEGGLTVIFEKDNVRGIIIFGYNELGIWIDFLRIGKEIIIDRVMKFWKSELDYDYEAKKYRERISIFNQLLRDYKIDL